MNKWIGTYAGYSKELLNYFVDAIQLLNNPHIHLIDPMCGGGNLLVECCKRNIACTGYDINVAQIIQAKAKLSAIPPSDSKKLLRTIRKIAPREIKGALASDDWFHPDVVESLLSFYNELHGAFDWAEENTQSILEAAFLFTLRRNSCHGASSNPTWLKKGGMIPGTSIKDEFSESLEFLLSWHQKNAIPNHKDCNCYVHQRDIQHMTDHDVYDVCITSPPYCNRMDYKRMFAPELEFYNTYIYKMQRDTEFIGTNAVKGFNDEEYEPTDYETKLLQNIRIRQCIDNRDYYYKYYKNYFRDLNVALDKSIRSIKHGGILLIAVQNSHYKDIAINLDDVIISKLDGKHLVYPVRTKERHFFGNLRKINKKQLESVLKIEKQ